MIYSSWDIECDRQKLVIMGHFLPFYTPPPKKPKKQNFEKMKKVTGDIIILHKCTKNDNHMRYGSFWAIFSSFTPLTIRKIKILKKWKKLLEMSSFYTCLPKITIIWCVLPEIWSATEMFLLFWVIFFTFTPLLTPKINIWKNCKK